MAKTKKPGKKSAKGSEKQKKLGLPSLGRKDWQMLLVVLVLTLGVFIPSMNHGFVNWDDDFNLANNNNTALLNWDNIVNIFSEDVIGNYNPLPILTFAIERHFFGLDPTVYHVNNILLHLVCVFFVFLILRLLNLSPLAAAAGALLFGVHPMRVESVVWVTERKDVLFGAFFLSALWNHIRYIRTGFKRKYFYFALGLFFFALLAKIQAVSLPLTMLAVDYYFRRPLQWKLVWEKWMFFLLSLVIGLVGIYFLRDQGSINDPTTFNIMQRLLIGGYSLGVYMVKFVVPYFMSPLYPYPSVFPWFMYLAPVPVLAIAAFIYIGYKKDWRPYVFGVLVFLVNVMFVLQILGAGQGFLADRFTYIPYLGFMFMVGYVLDELMKKPSALGKIAPYLLGVLMIVALWATYKQSRIWEDSDKLWTHVLKYTEKSVLPYRNRANYRRDQGRIEEALQDYNKAISLKPDGALYNSRAKLYFNLQNFDQAMTNYNEAIKMDSTEGEYFINRGAVFALTNRLQEALQDFNKGIELKPDHANGYKNRSLVYQSFGQFQLAIDDISIYLNMHPEDADLWYERGRLYNGLNKGAEALKDMERAIQLNNKQGLYHYEKLKSLLLLNRNADAAALVPLIQQFGITIEPEVQQRLAQ